MKLTNSLNVKQLIETEWFERFDISAKKGMKFKNDKTQSV